jgi:hypothetical protein
MWNSTRVALRIGAAALIAGCGGWQSPVGAPGAIPQRIGSGSFRLQPTLAQRVPQGTGEVQYISSFYGGILEFDYPKSESPIGWIYGYAVGNLCTKGAQTFWGSAPASDEVIEFKVGRKKAIATRTVTAGEAAGCAPLGAHRGFL